VLKRFPVNQVVLDYSQSFFSKPCADAMATIYSPKNFFGVSDGGLLISSIHVDEPETQDSGSLARATHLIKRLADSPESGYADYQRAELSLNECELLRMSRMTERVLSSIDFAAVRKKRIENFSYLRDRLASLNQISFEMPGQVAPLCYPFMTDDADLREMLIRNRIYVATYWPEVMDRSTDQWAERMVKNLLPLPIDQRYRQTDMERVVSIILGESA